MRPEWIALWAVVCAGASILYFTLRTGISPMPSNRLQRSAVLAAIETTDGPIYELGAGWGGLAFGLADRFPHAQVMAFELSWVPFAVMWLRLALRPRKNLVLRREDFLAAPLGGAQVLVCYLYRGGMEALEGKLRREAAGARLVTHTFAMRGWTAEFEQSLGDLYRTRVYVYRVARGSQ
jgi:hypothetical protein